MDVKMDEFYKEKYVRILRANNFNCFPIPKLVKIADNRYKASSTITDQEIKHGENYGYIPIYGMGNAILDLDNKEEYRKFAELTIADGFMVIETGKGWHIPICGLKGNISKTELFNYDIQDKKIIEIQGPDHYCVGIGCKIFHKELDKEIIYENRGTEKIWHARNTDFHKFIEIVCEKLNVVGKKKSSRSGNQYLRDRFSEGDLPTKGTSNDYFFQAAIQCNTEGLTQNLATKKIKIIYDRWSKTDSYSHRPWDNILAKIDDVYSNNIQSKRGRPKGGGGSIDRTGIAQDFMSNRKLYSNVETGDLYENNSGFLERINDELKRDLLRKYPQIERSDYESIIFKLVGLAQIIPPTNKNLIVFKNGVYDKITHTLIETDEIADMGFKEYDYLPPTIENNPLRWMSIIFDNIPPHEIDRMKRGLISVLENNLDPTISVIHGLSGMGKSTGLSILVRIMGVYAMGVELDQLLEDSFIRAKINGLRLLVLQDLPETWKHFSKIKAMTGEKIKVERGFQQDSMAFENKLKIFASTNYLSKIPEKEKNSMYTRRLSLIHNIRKEAFEENFNLEDDVVKEEGEKIISWILNLDIKNHSYENAVTVRKEWELLASPEIKFIQDNYIVAIPSGFEPDVTIKTVVNDFYKKTGNNIGIKQMKQALEDEGFVSTYNVLKNIFSKNQ